MRITEDCRVRGGDSGGGACIVAVVEQERGNHTQRSVRGLFANCVVLTPRASVIVTLDALNALAPTRLLCAAQREGGHMLRPRCQARGGVTTGFAVTDTVSTYDFASDTMSRMASLQTGFAAAGFGVIQSVRPGLQLLLATGGLTTFDASSTPVAAVREFDGAEWGTLPPLATARTYHGVAVVGNGTVLLAIGGSTLGNPTNQTGALASVEVFVL